MSEWIEWNGGDCPVDGETVVEIMMSSGMFYTGSAKYYKWRPDASNVRVITSAHVIKYRILRAAERVSESSNTKARLETENALENAVDCLIAFCKANQIDISISKDGSAIAHTSFGDFDIKNKSS